MFSSVSKLGLVLLKVFSFGGGVFGNIYLFIYVFIGS